MPRPRAAARSAARQLRWPPGDEIDDIRGADLGLGGLAEPVSESQYLEQIQDVRSAISSQSAALQELTDLTWSNPEANAIREQLSAALGRLRALSPPDALSNAHGHFVEGAELLARGFSSLVEATEHPDADVDRQRAEEAITEATSRFLDGANAINDYLLAPPSEEVHEDDLDQLNVQLEDVPLDDLLPPLEPSPTPISSFELPPALADELDDDIPPMPPELEELEPEPMPPTSGPPAFVGLGAPSYAAPPPMPAPEPPTRHYESEAWAGSEVDGWGSLGDRLTDQLLSEIEGGWVRGRGQVYEAIERVIRAAVTDALRQSLATHVRVEQEARATLTRLAGDRTRLLDEVEALRREAHGLQSEMADLRRTITELERERQLSQDRRTQMFQDAESQRGQLLKEIEQLGGQLETMRTNIVNLLNMSMSAEATALAELPAPPEQDGRQLPRR